MGYEGKATVGYTNINMYMPKRGKVIYPKDGFRHIGDPPHEAMVRWKGWSTNLK